MGSSPIGALRETKVGEKEIGETGQVKIKTETVSPLPQPPWEFLIEFIQVMADKVLLAGVGLYLYHAGADAKLYGAFFGALLYSLQSRRFKNR